MKTVIFIVQGYESATAEGQLMKVITFEVYAKSEKEDLDKCKKYVKKPFYRVSQVIEK